MKRLPLVLVACAAVMVSILQLAGAENQPPAIQHTPTTVALRGQSMQIKATVTDDSAVKSVTLFYSTSKDVAPFRLEMQSTGQNIFICTVPDTLLEFASTLTYYIEALDNTDQTSETRWFNVSIQSPASRSKTSSTPVAAKPSVSTAAPAGDDATFWKRTALIGGGVVLAGGAAAAIALGNSDDHNNTTPQPPATTNQYAGIYEGLVTTTLSFPNRLSESSSHGTTISIDINGTLTSSDLCDGASLMTSLSGSSFWVAANITSSNLTSMIAFSGNIQSESIRGSISGTAFETSGTNGVYSGTFLAVKR